ncbi:MAG: peptidylprolyl isomerase [Gemmatimonadota bacterium]
MIATLHQRVRRLLAASLAAVTCVTAVEAQQRTGRDIEVDRVVGVVGKHPILLSEVLEAINFARSRGLQVPQDSAAQVTLAREFLNSIIDKEVLIAVAKDYKIEVTEVDVAAAVDQQVDGARKQFQSEQQYRQALQQEGFGTPEEYRKKAIESAIRDEQQRRAIDSLRAKGRLAPANITEREVEEAFQRLKRELPPRPELVAFRQVVVEPTPSEASVERARTLADSLRLALEAGADFDSLARRFSEDPGSAVRGGDLDWQRRGVMVPEFERMMFALQPNRISPLVKTTYGFHVIRVDRVRAAEVRARHILIKPSVDTADVRIARERADSMRTLWAAGTSFDTLVARFHDTDEERAIPDGFPRDSLPAEYRVALKGVAERGLSEVFAIPDPMSGYNKWAVAQVLAIKPPGEYSLAENQERIRKQLREEKSIRRTLDNLRREMYVSLRL